jgi:hypothetical protein
MYHLCRVTRRRDPAVNTLHRAPLPFGDAWSAWALSCQPWRQSKPCPPPGAVADFSSRRRPVRIARDCSLVPLPALTNVKSFKSAGKVTKSRPQPRRHPAVAHPGSRVGGRRNHSWKILYDTCVASNAFYAPLHSTGTGSPSIGIWRHRR